MAVVIAPAVILSLLAIRAISHEEAYIEKQLEGTLTADVTHVASVVATEMDAIRTELAAAATPPETGDPGDDFDAWKRASALVEIPFLLSPDHEILWPVATAETGASAARKGESKEDSFAAEQEDFFSDKEKIPVYENIAVAFQDEILAEPAESEEPAATAEETIVDDLTVGAEEEYKTEADRRYTRAPSALGAAGTSAPAAMETETTTGMASRAKGIETRKQSAITEFQRSEEVRQKVFEKADNEGQELLYRNVAPSQVGEGYAAGDYAAGEAETISDEDVSDRKSLSAEMTGADKRQKSIYMPSARESAVEVEKKSPDAAPRAQAPPGDIPAGEYELDRVKAREAAGEPETGREAEPVTGPETRPENERGDQPETRPEIEREAESGADLGAGTVSAGRIRSVFIAQPLKFSEIVAERQSGIIPRTIDNRLRHIYWQRLPGGNIMGCLIDLEAMKERIVGALPNIYSPVRILTVLDENGSPLILPQGRETRDWRRPFVAVEISELLPRWESAAYLTQPDAITSRARATTVVMWILILILFVSILAGGVLVLRSAYAEVRLARQRTSFVANVSHELKTPLTSIRMFAEMLRDGRQTDPGKQKHYLDVMTAETERLARLINNVLDFSRMERGEKRYTMRTFDLTAMTREVVESERARLEQNGFEVRFTTSSGAVEINADEEAIKQTLLNLLSNAEKYSPETRVIDIEVGRDQDRAVLSVSDRGIGIPSGEGRRIFDEFYRVDDSLTSEVKGAGLGLTIARKIIADHGGDIRYGAREGGGSTFSIILPRAGSARPAAGADA